MGCVLHARLHSARQALYSKTEGVEGSSKFTAIVQLCHYCSALINGCVLKHTIISVQNGFENDMWLSVYCTLLVAAGRLTQLQKDLRVTAISLLFPRLLAGVAIHFTKWLLYTMRIIMKQCNIEKILECLPPKPQHTHMVGPRLNTDVLGILGVWHLVWPVLISSPVAHMLHTAAQHSLRDHSFLMILADGLWGHHWAGLHDNSVAGSLGYHYLLLGHTSHPTPSGG